MNLRLLAEHHLEFLSLKGGCTGLSESTLVKIPHCWKSHATAHIYSWTHCFWLFSLCICVSIRKQVKFYSVIGLRDKLPGGE